MPTEHEKTRVLGEELRLLAHEFHLPVPHLRVQTCATGARTGLEGPQDRLVLTADRRLLQAPAAVRRCTLLHELGHVALGHLPRRRQRAGEWCLFAILASAYLGAVCAPVLLYGQAGTRMTGLLLLPLLFCAVPAMGWKMACRRRQEFAADRWAAGRGSPLTEEHLRWVRKTYPGGSRRAPRLLSTHPSWAERLAALEDFAVGGVRAGQV